MTHQEYLAALRDLVDKYGHDAVFKAAREIMEDDDERLAPGE